MENTTVAEPQSGFSEKITDLLNKYPVILQLMRFAAIGILNTALDFLILNFLSKTLSINAGFKLGGINIPGFILAIFQSYIWNKYWTFSAMGKEVSVWKNFWRLVAVGLLGAVSVAVVLFGASKFAPPSFYLISLLLFVVVEVIILEVFGILKNPPVEGNIAGAFLFVSLVGLAINFAIVSLFSHLVLSQNQDLNKNFAKILATGISLVWNFLGYKLVVFKK